MFLRAVIVTVLYFFFWHYLQIINSVAHHVGFSSCGMFPKSSEINKNTVGLLILIFSTIFTEKHFRKIQITQICEIVNPFWSLFSAFKTWEICRSYIISIFYDAVFGLIRRTVDYISESNIIKSFTINLW